VSTWFPVPATLPLADLVTAALDHVNGHGPREAGDAGLGGGRVEMWGKAGRRGGK
jgi:hypothetical protein